MDFFPLLTNELAPSLLIYCEQIQIGVNETADFGRQIILKQLLALLTFDSQCERDFIRSKPVDGSAHIDPCIFQNHVLDPHPVRLHLNENTVRLNQHWSL